MKKFLILCLSILFTTPLFASGIDANATSAPCDNATLETYGGTANVEINWEPNTINLRWYDGDTRLNVQNAAQTCTYDDTLNVPSVQLTKTGYTFVGWELRMPGTYTELEYLESTGTQYINTGHTHVANENYEIDVTVVSVDSSYRAIIGAAPSGSGGMFYISSQSNGAWLCNVGMPADSVPLNTKLNIKLVQTSDSVVCAYVNGVLRQCASVGLYGHSLMLLARNSSEYPTIGKLYGAKIYNGTNSLIQNFIPARRNSDGVLGMWDTVTQTFFTNAGTGTFIAGPVVQ